ncbi:MULTISPECIES: class I SAM-dependent methyltransferase [unclassified Ensifer]|nr:MULTISPECIES: class I SAM-dependent methyltransferase [unclassified Ensifer]
MAHKATSWLQVGSKLEASAEIGNYWEEYYKHASPKTAPSLFAKFVINTYPERTCILDIGCGDGRDSIFFATEGKTVVGIDASESAIRVCKSRAAQMNGSCTFDEAVVSKDYFNTLDLGLDFRVSQSVIYSRFFLHAVVEEVEDCFLDSAMNFLDRGALLCIEFRTLADAELRKVEKEHFRRFISPTILMNKCLMRGMNSLHLRVGRGLAPYGDEDPMIARMVFSGRV